ncbi:type II toxin-antitoxin system VapC family toxin [Methylobacterium isbiliense]|jgi:ribonuclease VapC|uniref:Ribonuclease VapC n=1 Tax=Methylobacterium isbiliense TaxID=315478 RepID=A0ABQ4SH34_9HYPH|nr:type II toxin-antitoxin system VapC family toxin [Methylobacterium isbiliense]MDN3626222.1 type II toxin-antitoxin system VapC family toxin [Methylobacterium isbiliense]GJE00981.1 Ribonuclease VapC42 [Methylobacterium isbiliense]
MIVLDTSAIVAIALCEPEEETFSRVIASHDAALVGTPTLLETRMVLAARLARGAASFIDGFLARPSIRPVAFTLPMVRAASDAFIRYGRGRGHPAKLNLADCMSYAVAKHHALPLLFKGDDFVHTDLIPAAS